MSDGQIHLWEHFGMFGSHLIVGVRVHVLRGFLGLRYMGVEGSGLLEKYAWIDRSPIRV